MNAASLSPLIRGTDGRTQNGQLDPQERRLCLQCLRLRAQVNARACHENEQQGVKLPILPLKINHAWMTVQIDFIDSWPLKSAVQEVDGLSTTSSALTI